MKTLTLGWKELAEALGVLGVIGSLIFVAMEIRQNTAATQSATIQQIARWSYDNVTLETTDETLRAAIRADCSGAMTEDQQHLLTSYYQGLMRMQMNRFYQTKVGTIDQETALAIGGTGGPYTRPFFKRFWELAGGNYAPDFRLFVESELLPAVREKCGDNMAI